MTFCILGLTTEPSNNESQGRRKDRIVDEQEEGSIILKEFLFYYSNKKDSFPQDTNEYVIVDNDMDSRTEEQKIDDFETDEFQEELRKTKRLLDDFLERINRPEDYNFIYRNNEYKPFFPKGIINNEIKFPFEINDEGNLIYKVNETDTIRPENDFTPFTTRTKKALVSLFILRKNTNISGQPFYEFSQESFI